MRGVSSARLALPLVLLLGACAPVPRPSVLAELERVRGGAAATEAKRYAPDAFAHAEKLRRDADAAFQAEDTAGSQILGERALAAYAHAHAIARIARGDGSAAEAREALVAAQKELAGIEAEQARVAADLDALDKRIQVARDAQPIVPSGPADAEREKARLAAARSLSLQARLLCGAARLLLAQPQPGASPPDAALAKQLDESTAAVDKLDADLGGTAVQGAAPPAAAVPIDQASRVRAGCLAVLTAARRAATPVTRAPGVGDALLADLSAAGTWSPARDDRGIVVTLRGVFAGAGIAPAAEARLRDLARVAAAHPTFPVAVVVHSDRPLAPRDEPAWKARAEAVAQLLRAAATPSPRVDALVAGSAAPVVDPAGRERARNARVEIVFVTPETL